MGKKETKFRFKRFSAEHSRSSMKIGVDAVTLGSWASIPASGRILDVGTGCGVIALMCAQRSEDATIDAIDIDSISIEEATDNFNFSPWKERLTAFTKDFVTFADCCRLKYDLIISNPPYFDAGVDSALSVRMRARHKGELSPEVFLEIGKELLSEDGSIALVVPADQREGLVENGRSRGLFPHRQMFLRGRPDMDPKRFFVQFSLIPSDDTDFPEIVDVESAPGIYSERYRELGKDFYLAF